MNLVGIDCEHERDDGMATEALQTLVRHYPGHDWHVLIRGGVMHVKAINIHPQWGMCLHYRQIDHDANQRARSIVRSAGEFLERASQRRGMVEEAPVLAVEGIKDKYMARNGL